MKRDDLIILIIALLLLAGMLLTLLFGGEKSRHGVGILEFNRVPAGGLSPMEPEEKGRPS
ncbi:MAG: hypothetical protein RBR09_00785 [Desulfobulbaceae bacterium]|jgi:hypothetical protein|nr:hypothetical protein [Desulfobulbaceae bacterium]